MKFGLFFTFLGSLLGEVREIWQNQPRDYPVFALQQLESQVSNLKSLANARLGRKLVKDIAKGYVGKDAGKIVQVISPKAWGFGWEKGQFVRCQHPAHLTALMQISSAMGGDRVQLFNRYPIREAKPVQMKCMLYVRLNRVTRDKNKIHEVVFELKSNCKRNRFYKIFIAYNDHYYDTIIRNLKINFFQTSFEVYFGRSNKFTTQTKIDKVDLISKTKYLYTTDYFQEPSYKLKPIDLFYNMTYYQNYTEFSEFQTKDFAKKTEAHHQARRTWAQYKKINQSFDYLPKARDDPYFTSAEIDAIWGDKNPQNCPITYEPRTSLRWNWDYNSFGMVMNCQMPVK